MFNPRPDFLVGGVQKGGTTSLYRYLGQHPRVLECKRKEVGYFGDLYDKGPGWYAGQFPSAMRRLRRTVRERGRVFLGEATPYYLFHPHAPARVREYCPDVRLVFLLRDPVERAFSHHGYHRKLGEETLDFAAAVAVEEDRLAGELDKMLKDPSYNSPAYKLFSYVKRGLYAEQLQRWFALFPRDQFLIVASERFFAQPAAVFRETQEFLGLPVTELERYDTFNPGKKRGVPEPLNSQLREFYAEPNAQLFELLGEDFGWNNPVAD